MTYPPAPTPPELLPAVQPGPLHYWTTGVQGPQRCSRCGTADGVQSKLARTRFVRLPAGQPVKSAPTHWLCRVCVQTLLTAAESAVLEAWALANPAGVQPTKRGGPW